MAQNGGSLYVRIPTKDFFQTVQHDKVQKIYKNHLSEISEKFLFWANWVILVRFSPTIMQTYVFRSAVRNFFKLGCRIVEKLFVLGFSLSLFVCVCVCVCLLVCKLSRFIEFLRICCKNFSQNMQHGDNK